MLFTLLVLFASLASHDSLRIGTSWKATTTSHKKEVASLTQRVTTSFRDSSQWLKGVCYPGITQSTSRKRGLHMCSLGMQASAPCIEQSTLARDIVPLHLRLTKHESLVEGKLENGLTYVILPNANPAGRFEAHLEILSGSAKELNNQQGMAHLLEHVAYMGSPKRQMISGTGSRTNAYTDFHHTVFFAACPVQTPDQFWKRPMLPMALDALLDVMTVRVDDDRLEKERAAVLSEASMVNKMEYRVECQIISALHAENRIAQRFPIGKESLIKTWTKEDLQLYHDTHYRPDNAVLYIVGDINVNDTLAAIKQKFGDLRPKTDARKFLRDSAEFPRANMRDVSPHFPPVTHKWSCTAEAAARLVPQTLIHPVHHSTAIGDSTATVANEARNSDVISASLSETTDISTYVPRLKLFQHELLQSFSFHLFAKRPIEPINTLPALRRSLLQRMVLSALQIRLNVQQRQDPLFSFVDFNQLNWPREGCAVCSLDLTTDTATWRSAVMLAVQEIRRLGLFGLTPSELQRYVGSMQNEVAQAAAQSEQQDNEDVLGELMEAHANGHTYLHPRDRYAASAQILTSLTVEEVNTVARELCEHLSHMDVSQGVVPAAVVACAPLLDRTGAPFLLSEEEVGAAITDALSTPLLPLEDKTVPSTLLSEATVKALLFQAQPGFVNNNDISSQKLNAGASIISNGINAGDEASSTSTHGEMFSTLFGTRHNSSPSASPSLSVGEKGTPPLSTLGVLQKQLTNGMKVNLKFLDAESQRVSMRLYIPGGRLLETKNSPGAVALGARTMQEGTRGAFSNMTREDVELFCIDKQILVEVTATEEALIFDLESTTTVPHELNGVGGLSGAEAMMQVAHIILTDFKFEQDAFERAKQGMREQFDTSVKGLEGACLEGLAYSLTKADPRFLMPNQLQLDALSLDTVRAAISAQLNPANIEVSLCGDLSPARMQDLVLTYLGTVPNKNHAEDSKDVTGFTESHHNLDNEKQAAEIKSMEPNARPSPSPLAAVPPTSLVAHTLGTTSQLGIYLPDSEERAMGYLAGPAPNKWGRFGNGGTLYDKFVSKAAEKSAQGQGTDGQWSMTNAERWKDPVFAHTALLILQEVANRRLFSVVREERQLTYDASFTLQQREIVEGSWYTVSVTSSPAQVQSALQACKEALFSLQGLHGVSSDGIQAAKRTILNKFHTESATNKFWVEQLSGTQSAAVRGKSLASIGLFEVALQRVSAQDVSVLVEMTEMEEKNMTMCVGITAPEPPTGL